MSDGETHYDVLGISPTASKEEIRAAYNDRIGEVQADQSSAAAGKRPDETAIAASRAREADVRKAWQVLSDPYQRGRYDATIEAGSDDAGMVLAGTGEVEVVDDVPEDPREARRRARAEALANRPPGLFSPEPGVTPPTWPPGLHAPPNRARTLAMFVDLTVLALIFVIAQVVGVFAIDEIYPEETKALDRNQEQLDRIGRCIDRRPERADGEPAICREGRSSEGEPLRKGALENRRDGLEEVRDELQNDIAPATFGIVGVVLLVALLYLIPSSVRSGRTLGKKLFQIRAVQVDGTKLTFRAALLRYATPVLVSLLLLSLGLGPLAVVIVLFGILTWPRNANKQGLQDRLAGTLVVDG